jgi:hypothetical protein
MPIFGTLDYERQLARVPRVEDLAIERQSCGSVEVFVLAAEIAHDAGVQCVPPALNPVLPPFARVELRRHADSPWGPFAIACLELGVRAAGVPMAYVTGGFCDNDSVTEYLRLHYGARLKRASISVERRYPGIEGRIASEGRLVFDALMEKPEPIETSKVLPLPLLNLAKFEGNLWLIREDVEFDIEAAERGMTLVRTFDAEAFGEERVAFRRRLPAAFAKAATVYLPVAALFDPGQPASQGTRTIKG